MAAIKSEGTALEYIKQNRFVSALSVMKQATKTLPQLLDGDLFLHLQTLELCISCHVFQSDTAKELMAKKDWSGLKTYLLRFLDKNPIDEVDSKHPGLWLTFYELEMICHVEEEHIDLAMKSFRKNIESSGNDFTLCPLDYNTRVQNVTSSLSQNQFEKGYKERTEAALLNYVRLYFRDRFWPELKKDESWKQFTILQEAKCLSCLACGWVPPMEHRGMKSFEKHFCPPEETKPKTSRCGGITYYLMKKARKVFKIHGELSYDDFVSLYSKGKRVSAASGLPSMKSSPGVKSPKRTRPSALLESPAKRSRRTATTEPSSGSSPVKDRDFESPVKIIGRLQALNLELMAEVKPGTGIEKLCNEQGLQMYKLSRKACRQEYLELLPELFALDQVNLKFVEAVSDQSSALKTKMLEIADMSYKLRTLCMGSSAEAGQGKGSAVCRFAGDLVGSIIQVTMLIESNRTVAEYETLKDISAELIEAAVKVPKLFINQPLPSAVKECVLLIGLIRERLDPLPLMGSIADLRVHLLALDTALYQMVRVTFVE